jgi:DNA-binding transcriptional ArsR family regulator
VTCGEPELGQIRCVPQKWDSGVRAQERDAETLELLDLLCQGPRTVESLAEQAAISLANASQHLQVLRAARLVDADKKGLYVEYRLVDDDVSRSFFTLRALAQARLAEVDQASRQYFAFETQGRPSPWQAPEASKPDPEPISVEQPGLFRLLRGSGSGHLGQR